MAEEEKVEEGQQAEQEGEQEAEQQAAERLFAEKYKTPEELEKAYLNLQQEYGTKASLMGETNKRLQLLENQNQMLLSQIQDVKQQEQPDTNYEEQLKEIVRQIEEGDISNPAEGIIKAAQITALQAQEQSKQQIEQVMQQYQVQQMVDAFRRNNPDFDQLYESGTLTNMMQNDPTVRDEKEAYFKYQAMSAAQQTEQLKASIENEIKAAREEGKREIEKVRQGAEATKTTIKSPGASMKDQKDKPPSSSKEWLDSGMAALERHRSNAGK